MLGKRAINKDKQMNDKIKEVGGGEGERTPESRRKMRRGKWKGGGGKGVRKLERKWEKMGEKERKEEG